MTLKQSLYFLLTVAFSLGAKCYGQGQGSALDVFPVAPEQASFEKFVNHSVNISKGIPAIDVPMWEIKEKGFTLPIAVRYHAGGIKVQETASMTGLGWSLSAGGMISRAVYGLPDDGIYGFANSNSNYIPECPYDWSYEIYSGAESNNPDTQPDYFTYSTPSASGNFVWDRFKNAHQMPITKAKITYGPGQLFTIVDESGVIYEFNKPESAYTSQNGSLYVAAWYLTKIKFPWADSSHDITFDYESYSTQNSYFISETKSDYSPLNRSSDIQVTQSQAWRLTKITYSEGEIIFTAGAYRHDLKGAQVLESVAVKNRSGNVLKTFRFNYNYFWGTSMREFSQMAAATATTNATTSMRLSLKSVQEFAGDSQESKPPYIFSYEDSVWLPDRLTSKALDHWGYYNGKTTNTSLIPDYHYTEGGKRFIDSVYVKAGVLKKVKYPTGGYSTYRYGINKLDPALNKFYPEPNQPLSVSGYVRPCNISAPVNFTVHDAFNDGINFSVNFQGYVPSSPAPTGCGSNTVPISQNNTGTYLMFKIFNVNNLVTPVFTSQSATVTGVNVNNTFPLYLPNGDYVLKIIKGTATAEATGNDAVTLGTFSFSMLGYYNVAYDDYKPAGGLRVEAIKTFDSDNSLKKYTKYEYLNSAGFSSGITNKLLNYEYKLSVSDYPENEHIRNVWYANSNICDYSDDVNYARVVVYEGRNTETNEVGVFGKTEYTFTTPRDLIISPTSAIPRYNNYLIPIAADTQNCFTEAKVNSAIPLPESTGNKFPFVPNVSQSWHEGLPLTETIFSKASNGTFRKIRQKTNTYKDDYYGSNSVYNSQTDVIGAKVATYYNYTDNDPVFGNRNIIWKGVEYFYYPSRLYRLTSTTIQDYNDAEQPTAALVSNFDYGISLPFNLLSQNTVNSLGETLSTEYKYPGDLIGVEQSPYMQNLSDANRISDPVITKTFNGTNKISESHTKFGSSTATANLLQPIESHSRKGAGNIAITATEDRKVQFTKYNTQGNILEYKVENGTSVSIIWGYNGLYPIAKIENATFASVLTALSATEASLLALTVAPSNIRTVLPNAMITTYTYQPLVGVSTVTDPKGYKITYEYDSFSRLLYVKDADGKILSENQYHYQP